MPLPELNRVSSLWSAAPWLIAAAAGAAQALSIAWPGHGQPLWWLQILSLALLAHGLRNATRPRSAAAQAWLFASCWLAATFWWLFISMHTYGGLAAPLAVLAVLALATFLGGYYALAAWAFVRFRPARGSVLLFVACWTLAELARGSLWTGFPWGASGYAHVAGPLSVLPRWLGVYGTGAVAAALAYGLAGMNVDAERVAREIEAGVAAAAQSLHGQVHGVSDTMRLFRLQRGDVSLSQIDAVALRRAAHPQQLLDA